MGNKNNHQMGYYDPLNSQLQTFMNQHLKTNTGFSNQNHMEAASKAIMHQQMLLHSSPLFRDKLQPQKQLPVPIKPIQ